MAALLSATIGISVQQMYCYCVGKTTVAIFSEAVDACGMARRPEKKAACCTIPTPAKQGCCSGEAQDTAFKAQGCSRKSVQVFQLNVEFLVGQPLDLSFDLPIWADEFPEYMRLFRPVVCEALISNKAPPAPPPSCSGRVICLRHGMFRC